MSQRKFKFVGPSGFECEAVAGADPATGKLFLNVFELPDFDGDDDRLLWSSANLGEPNPLTPAVAVLVVGGFTQAIPGNWVDAVTRDERAGAAAGAEVSDHTP